MRAQRAFLRSDEGEAAGGRAHCSAQPHAAAHAHHVQARAAQVCPASRFAVNNASLLAVDPPSIRSLIAAPNPLRSFADFTALRYVGSATATSCMQKAKQLGLCDDDAPPSAADAAPKKRPREKGAGGGGDGMRQLAIDGGIVIEPKAARVYKPKPGSAQEAVLRALISVQAHSDDGLVRDDLLQQAQQFTGDSSRAPYVCTALCQACRQVPRCTMSPRFGAP